MLFVMVTLKSVDEIVKCNIQINAFEQYFSVVLFIKLYKVALNQFPFDRCK